MTTLDKIGVAATGFNILAASVRVGDGDFWVHAALALTLILTLGARET